MRPPNTPVCGLVFQAPNGSPTPVPLCGVEVLAKVDGGASEVTLRQRFRNDERRPIEAVYVFPLPTTAAVCGFAAEVGGRRVEGRVEERERAFEIYDDAMAEGHGAFLLDQERPNVFTVSVGNLAPGSEAILELRWVATLQSEGPAFRFQLPTTVSPRYVPRAAIPEVGEPDGERVNPERLATVPYGLRLTVDVATGAGLPKRVESPSHPIRTSFGTGLRVELAHDEVALDRDFVLIVEPTEVKPVARVARAEGERFVQVDFVPDQAAMSEGGAEVVFVVDCSGSMEGTSMTEAKRALELCVRALDERDTFDIVRFGSHHESLFGAARPFSEATLEQALAYIAATDANLGGTEILAPLQAIYQRPTPRPRNVLLLTDGQVSNEAAVITLAEAYAAHNRVFSFGIGAGVSEHLVREVARRSRGQVELIAPGERIEPKVLRQFGRVRTPALGDVTIDWGGLEVEAAPRVVPPVFAGDPLVVWARVVHGDAKAVTLKAGERRWSVPLDLERAAGPEAGGGPIPTLWARAMVAELEAGEGRHGSAQQRPGRDEARKRKCVELAKRFRLMSSLTSFVAIEVRSADQRLTSGAELRKVPIALTAGWGGQGSVATGPKKKSAARPAFAAPGGLAGAMPPPPAPAPAYESLRRARPSFEADEDGFVHDRPQSIDAWTPSPPSHSRTLEHVVFPQPEAAPARRARLADWSPDPTPAPAPVDALYELLRQQRADGSFPAEAVTALVRKPEAWRAALADRDPKVVATTAVLWLFEHEHGERRDEWRAAAEKAQRFLAKLSPFDASILF